MSEFIAESVIIIKANTKPFAVELAKAAKAAEKLPVTITVRASLKGFRTDLIQQLKVSSKGVTVKVLVRPDLTGFRTELVAATRAAAKGVTVPVAITGIRAPAAAAAAAGAPARGTGAAAAGATQAAKAERALADALAAQSFARKRVVGDMTAQEKSIAILKREEASLAAAEKAVTTAVTEQNAAVEAQARALVRTQAAAVEKRRGVISRRQAQIDAPQLAQQQARQKVLDDAAAIDKQKQTLVAKGESAHTRIVQAEATKRAQIDEAFEKREEELRTNRAQAIEKALKQEERDTVATSQRILGSRAQADEKALKERLRLESQLGKLQRQTRALPAPGGLTGSELSLASRRAGETQRAAIKAADDARKAGLPTLAKEFSTLEAENNATREQIALQKRLNTLREQSRVAQLPQTGRTPAAGLSKEANQLSRAERAAQLLAADARKVGATEIEREASALAGTSGKLKQERIDLVHNTEAHSKNLRARTDVKRAAQSQLLTFAGLRGAALSAESAFLFAAAGTIAFVKAVQSAAALQTELNTFRATAGATADQMIRVSDTARELGRDISLPGVNAQDAAQALTELSKAGLSVEDSIDGARGVLQLATAASIDNAEATELAASALNAFGLAGADATHVADVLANAANDSQGSIVDIGIALQQSAAVARQAGLSLEQTVGALTLFARAGLKGSDAGTSFRTALIRLINPTTKAQAVIDRLGLHLRTATGDINLGVFDEFRRKTQDLTAAQRDQALAIIFGQDAIRGAAILARTGSVAFDQQIASLNKAGTAAELAAARTSGLAGAMENLKNQLTDAGVSIGESLSPALINLANIFSDAVRGGQALFDSIADLRKAAAKPIDVVVNFVEDKTGLGGLGGGGGKRGPIDRIKDFFASGFAGPIAPFRQATQDTRDFIEAVVEAQAQLEDITGQDLVSFPTIKQARKDIQDLVDELNKSGGSPRLFNTVVTSLQEIQKGMEGGTAETKQFAKSLQPFIEELQRLSGLPDIEIPIKIPAAVLQGTFTGLEKAGHQSGIITAEEFSRGFLPPFGESLKDAGKTLKEAFGPAAEAAGRQIAETLRRALLPAKRGENQALGFSRAETQARIRGSVDAQIQAIQGTAASQRKIIDAINKATGGAPTGKLLERRTRAENTLADALDRIESLQQQQASDIKDKAAKIKQARDEADQAVVDAFAPRRDRLDIAATKASATETLRDDLAVQVALANEISREIGIIDKTVKDQKTRRDLIAARVKELVASGTQIDTLRKQFAENATKAAKDARDLVTSKIGKQLQLAQLVGKKDPILNAFDRAIKDARLRVKNWKKLGLVQLDEKIALQQLINDRKDFLDQAKKGADETKHTTAFDLLGEFNAKFNDIAGNVVNQNQPFAGSSAFSTDIVNKAIAGFQQGGLPHRPIDIRLRGDDQQSKQISVTEKLIAVIQENTDVIRGGRGNRSTQSVFVPGEIEGKNKLAAFWAARTAREVKDG